VLICRTEKPMEPDMARKISLFCNVRPEAVIEERDVDFSIYQVPLMLMESGLPKRIFDQLHIEPRRDADTSDWRRMLEVVRQPKHTIEIAVSGKYIELHDAYKSIYESLSHAGIAHSSQIKLRKVSAEAVANEGAEKYLAGVHGILVPGGFGERGFEGKIASIKYARVNKIPFFGICYGMQAAAVEYARSVLGITDATTTEYDHNAANPVIALMEEQKRTNEKGGTMRLGSFDCTLKEGTNSHRAYGTTRIAERHRHRFEFNNAYRNRLQEAGLVMAGVNPKLDLVEIVEIKDHPWFVGVQYHPEFKTQPMQPHPLFRDFIGAAVQYATKGRR
jgi:CTP synthase